MNLLTPAKSLWLLYTRSVAGPNGKELKQRMMAPNNPMKDIVGANGYDMTKLLDNVRA
jgi:hypothetical protein